MPTATTPLSDRIALAKLIGEELQSPGLYGAPIRIRKFNVQGRSVTGEFVGTADGRSYSFTYANGKVTYQPAIAKMDSESVIQFAVRWDSYTEALEAKVSNPVRLDATGKRLRCGTASYQCGGVCLGVHKGCHKNEKAAVDHDRLNKINALIDHLSQGGEHPSKALDKPGVEKLQTVAEGIQKTRDLRAANLIAKRTGDRLAQARAVEVHMKANYPELHSQIESAVAGYEKEHTRAKKALEDFRNMASSVDRAAKDIQAENAEQIANPAMLAAIRQKAKTEADRQILEESLKAKPASMTVGAIAPGTDKPMQLIPQSKTITPEVLPPETPRKMRSRAEKEADLAKIKTNLEEAARGIAHTAILQHAAYQTALGGDVSPESIKHARQAAGDLAVAKLRAGNQQKAFPGSGGKRQGTKAAIAATQQSVKEAAVSTAKAAVAHQKFMKTAMQMAKENDRQTKTITPEVLPPETPKGGAKKRIAGLLDKLQENHETGTKNAAQISAVAHTALKGLDPTHTPKLSEPTASTYEPPRGSGRQRVAKLMGDLQQNHEADVKNAAMTYAVAQSAVNQLKAQEAGQKAAPKQLSGQAGASGGGGSIGGSQVDQIGKRIGSAKANLDFYDREIQSASSQVIKDGSKYFHKNTSGGLDRSKAFATKKEAVESKVASLQQDHENIRQKLITAYHDVLPHIEKGGTEAEYDNVGRKTGKHIMHVTLPGGRKEKWVGVSTPPDEKTPHFYDATMERYYKPQIPESKQPKLKDIESAPAAPKSRSRTAGEVTPQYPRNRHVSIDSRQDNEMLSARLDGKIIDTVLMHGSVMDSLDIMTLWRMDATLAELRVKVKEKNATLPKGEKFNTFGKKKEEIEAFLGVKSKPSETKTAGKPRHETKKLASATAKAIAEKIGGDADVIQGHLHKQIQKGIDKKRQELKRQGKEASLTDLKAAAEAVVQHETKAILDKHKPATKVEAKTKPRSLESAKGFVEKLKRGEVSKYNQSEQRKAEIASRILTNRERASNRTPHLTTGRELTVTKKALDRRARKVGKDIEVHLPTRFKDLSGDEVEERRLVPGKKKAATSKFETLFTGQLEHDPFVPQAMDKHGNFIQGKKGEKERKREEEQELGNGEIGTLEDRITSVHKHEEIAENAFKKLPKNLQKKVGGKRHVSKGISKSDSKRHVSLDSLVAGIAQLQQRGTHIDSATVLDLLRKADNCGCDKCQHKDETSKYDRLVKSLAAKGVDDPKALAAAIGRRKLGKKEFQRRAKAGKRRAAKA